VNITDVLLILDNWGESTAQYDVDEDGTVGIGDILFVISQWGECEE
jgi:hypothetical protein